jgi:hypothetical protein
VAFQANSSSTVLSLTSNMCQSFSIALSNILLFEVAAIDKDGLKVIDAKASVTIKSHHK